MAMQFTCTALCSRPLSATSQTLFKLYKFDISSISGVGIGMEGIELHSNRKSDKYLFSISLIYLVIVGSFNNARFFHKVISYSRLLGECSIRSDHSCTYIRNLLLIIKTHYQGSELCSQAKQDAQRYHMIW